MGREAAEVEGVVGERKARKIKYRTLHHPGQCRCRSCRLRRLRRCCSCRLYRSCPLRRLFALLASRRLASICAVCAHSRCCTGIRGHRLPLGQHFGSWWWWWWQRAGGDWRVSFGEATVSWYTIPASQYRAHKHGYQAQRLLRVRIGPDDSKFTECSKMI